ncbi:MFS transporter [Brevibacillus ginsengisoli]|uniref:MFS transporter n=1 Tax=Brevibacillus ginsengisoli TaxID=363854 RepID=UPI003CEECB65
MSRPLLILFLMIFFIGTDTFLLSPLLPTLQQQFQVPKEISGWMVGAYALGYALFALVVGPISDRLNRKSVMIVGFLAFAISTALCGLATGFASMIVFRLLAGISAAIVSPQIWAAIPFLVPQERIIKAMGIVTAGLSVAQLLGVPLGSLVGTLDWSVPFYLVGGLSVLLLFFIHKWIPTMPAQTGAHQLSIVARYRQILFMSSSKQAFLGYFLFQIGNFSAFTFIGTFLADYFSLSLAGIGGVMILLGTGNLVGSLTGGYIVQQLGRFRTFVLSVGMLVVVYLTLPLSAHLLTVQGLFFLAFFSGGLLFPIMMSGLQAIDPASRGTIASLSNSIMYAGTTVGSALAGILYAKFSGFHSISLFTAACFFFSLLLFVKSGILASSSLSPIPTKAKSGSV